MDPAKRLFDNLPRHEQFNIYKSEQGQYVLSFEEFANYLIGGINKDSLNATTQLFDGWNVDEKASPITVICVKQLGEKVFKGKTAIKAVIIDNNLKQLLEKIPDISFDYNYTLSGLSETQLQNAVGEKY